MQTIRDLIQQFMDDLVKEVVKRAGPEWHVKDVGRAIQNTPAGAAEFSQGEWVCTASAIWAHDKTRIEFDFTGGGHKEKEVPINMDRSLLAVLMVAEVESLFGGKKASYSYDRG